ncbi:uncharacterized protein LOC5505011 isoform X1 [Nematostella vectensis]|uniref:uncharacterized protein LOC5505011 isoform X1 n=1 Tax=Nematostella vectensis TaxID=45351 RepID=UPI0020772727|nr:uncharacterized protein LOC5505011 isoform X1 [Nematostella vectensis]
MELQVYSSEEQLASRHSSTSDFGMEESPSSEVDVEGGQDGLESSDYIAPVGTTKEYSRNLTPTHQTKKNLYLKLDEILIDALHREFEVYPGATVDRIIMVNFLSNVVVSNIPSFPDLQKIMCLRDTVLTARVKRAFPDVEYKRKQIRQDHFRKAWLYVNIRKRLKSKDEDRNNGHTDWDRNYEDAPHHDSKSKPQATVSWKTEASPSTEPRPLRHHHSHHSPLNTPALPQHTITRKSGKERQTRSEKKSPAAKEDKSLVKIAPMPSQAPGTPSAPAVTEYNPQERSAVVVDNYSIAKWVKSHYVEDSSSYVPVQDVVKTFKQSFGLEITYKECHQMIYSAFTSPRQRTCPLKTVRVSSMGAQYVYRGIAPAKNDGSTESDTKSYDDSASPPEPTVVSLSGNPIQDEREEIWQKLVEEMKVERDQAVTERNQALSVLMEVEKEYSKALLMIEDLRKEKDIVRVEPRGETATIHHRATGHEDTKNTKPAQEVLLTHHRDPVNESASPHRDTTQVLSTYIRDHISPRTFHYYPERLAANAASLSEDEDHIKEERDQIWSSMLVKTRRERDEARSRLEIVKKERDCYLERLHHHEKENQRLRDMVGLHVGAEVSTTHVIRPLPTFAHALGTNSADPSDDVRDGKEALDTVLSRLKSKRKQSTPTKLSKLPRLSRESPQDASTNGRLTPVDVTSGGNASEVKSADCSESPESETICEEKDPDDMLLFFEGSDMVAFRPHPMET